MDYRSPVGYDRTRNAVIGHKDFDLTYLKMDYRSPAGYDRTRNAVIGHKDFDLTYLEEAYTSEHWLVRVYRVKKPDEFNRPRIEARDREIKSKKPLSKKSNKRKRGVIKSRPTVI